MGKIAGRRQSEVYPTYERYSAATGHRSYEHLLHRQRAHAGDPEEKLTHAAWHSSHEASRGLEAASDPEGLEGAKGSLHINPRDTQRARTDGMHFIACSRGRLAIRHFGFRFRAFVASASEFPPTKP